MKRIKVLTIGDHPLAPGGVSKCMRDIINSLLNSNEFDVISLGGAMKHQDYRPMRTQEWGDRWTIYPVDGFGSQELVREVLLSNKIDILLFQSDPRFYEWLLAIDDEIRKNVPMVWYCIWDNYPLPTFNKPIWMSVDRLVTISKVTDDIMSKVVPEVKRTRMPHCMNYNVYKSVSEEDRNQFRATHEKLGDKFVVFWNAKNGGRKHGATLIHSFATWISEKSPNAVLLMHTDPFDVHGPNLQEVANHFGLHEKIFFSTEKLPDAALSLLYNAADVTISISDAEGFGMPISESLLCETPVIVNMTGGMQEQVTDGKEFFGIGIEPKVKTLVGTQQVPFIYEDRVAMDDVVDALDKIYNMSHSERSELGRKGREYLLKNYNWDEYNKFWPEYLKKTHEECGSWPNKEFSTQNLVKI